MRPAPPIGGAGRSSYRAIREGARCLRHRQSRHADRWTERRRPRPASWAGWRRVLALPPRSTRACSGMIAALAIIWIGFNVVSGGDFLTPRNLWNLSVQSASIGIMATGMVLIIVSRNIDLSVGSMLGFLGYTMAMVQTIWIPHDPRARASTSPTPGSSPSLIGLVLGAIIGGLQGFVVGLRRRAVVHRHAGRPPGLARADLQLRPGADPGAARHDVPPARRRTDRIARRVAELDRRRHRAASRSSSACSPRAAGAGATDSRCARCGPRLPSACS